MQMCLHVFFSGNVQGVGFRYVVDRIAHHFIVTGFVRNLSDGRVELFAEGDQSVLQDFLKAIRESPMERNIHELEFQWAAAKGDYKTFGIAHH